MYESSERAGDIIQPALSLLLLISLATAKHSLPTCQGALASLDSPTATSTATSRQRSSPLSLLDHPLFLPTRKPFSSMRPRAARMWPDADDPEDGQGVFSATATGRLRQGEVTHGRRPRHVLGRPNWSSPSAQLAPFAADPACVPSAFETSAPFPSPRPASNTASTSVRSTLGRGEHYQSLFDPLVGRSIASQSVSAYSSTSSTSLKTAPSPFDLRPTLYPASSTSYMPEDSACVPFAAAFSPPSPSPRADQRRHEDASPAQSRHPPILRPSPASPAVPSGQSGPSSLASPPDLPPRVTTNRNRSTSRNAASRQPRGTCGESALADDPSFVSGLQEPPGVDDREFDALPLNQPPSRAYNTDESASRHALRAPSPPPSPDASTSPPLAPASPPPLSYPPDAARTQVSPQSLPRQKRRPAGPPSPSPDASTSSAAAPASPTLSPFPFDVAKAQASSQSRPYKKRRTASTTRSNGESATPIQSTPPPTSEAAVDNGRVAEMVDATTPPPPSDSEPSDSPPPRPDLRSFYVGLPRLPPTGPLSSAYNVKLLKQLADSYAARDLKAFASPPQVAQSLAQAQWRVSGGKDGDLQEPDPNFIFLTEYDAALRFSRDVADRYEIELDETRKFVICGWTAPRHGHHVFYGDDCRGPTAAIVRALDEAVVRCFEVPCAFVDVEAFAPTHDETLRYKREDPNKSRRWSRRADAMEAEAYGSVYRATLRFEKARMVGALVLGEVPAYYLGLSELGFPVLEPELRGPSPPRPMRYALAPHPRSLVSNSDKDRFSLGLFAQVLAVFQVFKSSGDFPSVRLKDVWEAFRTAYGHRKVPDWWEVRKLLRKHKAGGDVDPDDDDLLPQDLRPASWLPVPVFHAASKRGCGAHIVVSRSARHVETGRYLAVVPQHCPGCGGDLTEDNVDLRASLGVVFAADVSRLVEEGKVLRDAVVELLDEDE
ncbi:hypothetical protein NBRC10512_002709 [Rhodotorula toruloides]